MRREHLPSYNLEAGQFKAFGLPDPPVPLNLAISDAVHNLRASLDYLVFELAFKDSGIAQDGTQFPITDVKCGKGPGGNPIGFDAVADRYLKGISPPHRDMIESLQPYKGWDALETLREISNPDKHRELTVINPPDSLHFMVGNDASGRKLPTGEIIQIDETRCFSISLPKKDFMVPTVLHYIKGGVEDALRVFSSEF
jgi:hypothetical protein